MRARVKDSDIPREEIRLTSKIWPTEYGEGKTLEGIDSFEAADTLFTVLTHAKFPD